MVSDAKRMAAFRPLAKALGVQDSEMEAEFQRVQKEIPPPRYAQYVEILSRERRLPRTCALSLRTPWQIDPQQF